MVYRYLERPMGLEPTALCGGSLSTWWRPVNVCAPLNGWPTTTPRSAHARLTMATRSPLPHFPPGGRVDGEPLALAGAEAAGVDLGADGVQLRLRGRGHLLQLVG